MPAPTARHSTARNTHLYPELALTAGRWCLTSQLLVGKNAILSSKLRVFPPVGVLLLMRGWDDSIVFADCHPVKVLLVGVLATLTLVQEGASLKGHGFYIWVFHYRVQYPEWSGFCLFLLYPVQ